MTELRAVVFDLYGTLVPEFPLAEWDAMFELMARALGAEPAAFRDAWDATIVERQTGGFADVRENVLAICARIVLEPTDDGIERALEVRSALYRKRFRPKLGAVETLAWLRRRRYPTALVSMCAPDTPELWHASPLGGLVDVTVFSSEVGMRKPDPRIYLLACERLEVEPAACLYVGDGNNRELSGAAAVGMSPVLIADPVEEGMMLRMEAEDWDSPTIFSIPEVRTLLRA